MVHHYILLHVDGDEQKKQDDLTAQLTGRTGTVSQIRVDERGIQMPDWWTDDETTESAAMQNMYAMRSWRGGAT